MLREIVSGQRQEEGRSLRRRWFQGEGCDLFVWGEDTGDVVAFQLAWEHEGRERVVAWRRATGRFDVGAVDDGEANPERNHTPLLIDGGDSNDGRPLLDAQTLARLHADVTTLPEPLCRQLLDVLASIIPGQPE
ncbi:MAG: hypothetical protein HQL66_14560 [Magnetococcales bacterium]|nr:hypothetical protein [Magnetococcales bacterium]